MLQVKNLIKRFGDREVVHGVSFAVGKGESFGLLGPNGAGKSTTIAMICGLLVPNAGEIYVGGVNMRENPRAAKRLMGVIPQDIALYPALSARENLNFWGALYGLYGKELRTRVDAGLEIVALADRQKERIETFSGGMKRRINIAASLLHQPALLIMDEPTAGVDPQSRNNILETVKRLNAEQGLTVVYTSHYMEEVEYLCGRLAILDHGRVIAGGTLDDVRHLVGTDVTVRLKVREPGESLVAAVAAVSGVRSVQRESDAVVALVDEPAEDLPDLLAAVRGSGQKLLGVEVEEPNLETVFLHLTGRALRD
ncbi:MAG TPA: ABC transporter ATP-binding protein [Symbiobacteriaceae bacterium]|jgi:ABC-2 type transport system ATP-binding protein